MSKASRYEESKFLFNVSAIVRRALEHSAVPMQLNASPDIVRKYERVIYERLLPPRDDSKRPFLRLDNAPAVPFMADRSLKPGTVVLITDKDLPGIAIDLSTLAIEKTPGEKKLVTVDERVTPAAKAEEKRVGGIWSQVKDRVKGIFG